MRKNSLVVTSVIDESLSKVNESDDYDMIHSSKDFSSSDTTLTPDSQLPPKETNASSQPERETTPDINNATSSTSIKTEKLSSPPPDTTTNEGHDDAEKSSDQMRSFSIPEAMSPPSTGDTNTDHATIQPTVGTLDDQSNSNAITLVDIAPASDLVVVAAANGNHNDQTPSNPLSPLNTSLPPHATDSSIHQGTATNNPTSIMDTSSPNSALNNLTTAPTPLAVSTDTISVETASSISTTTNTEATPPAGGKTKRKKRQPYQTPTAEQLEALVNGHLNDKLSISAAARRAGIARSTASSLMKKHKTQGGIPQRQPRGRTAPAKIQMEQAQWIDQYLRDNESATLETIRMALLVAFPNIRQISLSGLQRNITLKCSRHLKRRRQNKRTEES